MRRSYGDELHSRPVTSGVLTSKHPTATETRHLITALQIARCRFPASTDSVEHDGLVAVDEHAPFEMPTHRLRQDQSLEDASFPDQVLDIVAMCHARDVLMNDRPFIQITRRIM